MSSIEQVRQGAGGATTSTVADSWYVTPTDGTNIIGTSSHPIYTTGGATNAGAANGATGQVSVTSTATLVAASRTTRRSIKVTNTGTTDVYIGFTSGVTTSTGDLLVGAKGAFISIPTTSAVYAIVASGSVSVSYVEAYD
jgi:hypothetical protein